MQQYYAERYEMLFLGYLSDTLNNAYTYLTYLQTYIHIHKYIVMLNSCAAVQTYEEKFSRVISFLLLPKMNICKSSLSWNRWNR